MRFMLMQTYGQVESGAPPVDEWTPADIKAHVDFQIALNQELIDNGEFVDAQGLAGPDQAKTVVSNGKGAPVVTDGPYPETKELLAGFRIVEVDTLERALDLAARISAAPGPDGVPVGDHIEVRQIMGAPDPEV